MINLIRIDDRLIHGQVMAVWVRALGATHIVVADDETAGDEFARDILHLAVPAHLSLNVDPVETAGGRLAERAGDATRTLVLLKSVESAVRLRAAFAYAELNVGGVGMAPGRRLVWRSIALSPPELDSLRRLQAQGVRVAFQMIPADPRKPLDDIAPAR